MGNKLNKKDLNKLFLRLNTVRLTLNYESMQGVGFMRAMAPALKKIYADDEEALKDAMKRESVFFNSHVNGNALILGIATAMEEQTGDGDKDSIAALKTGLMGPLAGLGDSLVKFTWVPIVGSVGAALALNGSIIGPILFFVLYNIVNILGRYYGVVYGYEKGLDFLQNNADNDIIKRISNMANVLGLMVVGSLIATSVKVSIPLKVSAGENVIEVQEMLDKIMPNFLGLLITFIVYRWLKKNNGNHAAATIIGIMILTIVLTHFGIL